ncbi:BREX-1 system phosphatase PglZ type A [Fictibacillus terranigra]|uniref:BREX-1 system phosphatase PglZ type A n=1 Tax=Fictibacillus terranigra TaxID=3058424 RepID=A0ABT8EDF9_9BACL|nr:BREX-1 system phosphatase PglZ type A [Fictibacillus sp. CENA-BCM004]MDN4075859.1 BREX-1 system phosphatase PglZ type A [Fictibacillus sp. CENA-BCM004]
MNVIELLKERIEDELYKKNKPRTVIFWYDEQGEYSVSDLEETLAEQPIHIRQLTRNNFFTLKLEIELEKKRDSFLLYADFAKPAIEDNFLLDTELYGTEFKADTNALLAEQLQVSDAILRPLIKEYGEFFKSAERKNKLKKVVPPNASERDIEYAMLAVLTGAPIANMEEITRHLLLRGLQEETNEVYKAISKRFSTNRMWEHISEYFGLHSSDLTLKYLMEHVLYAHFKLHAQFEEQSLQKKYETTRGNVCALFIDDWLHTKESEVEVLETYMKEIEQRFSIIDVLHERPIEQFADISTFPIIDHLLINRLTVEFLHQTSNFDTWKEILNKRLKMHWAKRNERIERLLNVLLDAVDLTKYKMFLKQYDTREPLYVQYTSELYLIDQAYRRFMTGFTQLENKEMLEKLAEQLTNWYENKYLLKIAQETNYLLENAEVGKLPKQAKFYKEVLQPVLEKESTRVFVIISDAVRYEVGAELVSRLNLRSNGVASISPLVANMPTYTQLGMASLLPHKVLSFTENGTVLADDQPTNGLANRTEILQAAHPEAIAYRLTDLLDWSRATADENLKGKRLVYLYHDVIDAAGDSAKSERATYIAAERAIKELSIAVDRLSKLQAKRIFITADHGFLYQYPRIENDIKVVSVKGEIIDSNRRFAVGHHLLVDDGAINVPDDFSTLEGVEKVIAKGVNRFIGGGGLQFVHGGATPQEVIVPLIDYRRTSQAVLVEISVAMPKRVITGFRIQVPIYQEQSISQEYKARTIRAAFYLNGERISNEIEWTFDMVGENHERTEQLTFNLVESYYPTGQTCELRMLTVEDDKVTPYRETEFTIHMYNALY